MNSIYFSVIIPTLNEERYLPKLFGSLVNQKFNSFETIVVDAFSDDKTLSVAKSFAPKLFPLHILKSKKRNVSYQRNIGAKIAKGSYLVFFDADVEIDSMFLFSMFTSLERNSPDLATTWIIPDSKYSTDELIFFLSNVAVKVADMVDLSFVSGCNLIVKRGVFTRIGGFNEKLKISEDHDFVQRAIKEGFVLQRFKEPKLTVSCRRMRHEGTMRSLLKYTYAALYFMIRGSTTEQLFSYPMGGHLYDQKKLKSDHFIKRLQVFERLRLIESLRELPKRWFQEFDSFE